MATDTVVLNLSDSPLWAPYKALYNTVNNAVIAKDVDAIPELEAALKNHKPDFICLLKNPVRSQIHREAVKKASTSGIAVSGQPGSQILTQQLVDEALIISDMFDLNELTSLELLIAGQQQQPHFPGLTRGLVAMLLYYDGRRSLVNALRTLIQAREGRSWTVDASPELAHIITSFTYYLMDEGLVMNVISLIEGMNLSNELDLLHKNRALGGPRYRKQVTDLISEIKQSLAEIVFCCACQGSLTHEEVLRLVSYLSKQTTVSNTSALDEPTVTLLMALLYVIHVGSLQTHQETDPAVDKLNLVYYPDLLAAIHKELYIFDNSWQNEGIKSILQFAWCVTLRTLSQFPVSSLDSNFNETFEDEEKLIDFAIEKGAFLALKNLVVMSSIFHQEEFFLKRIHDLVTDFIVLMPIKVKEMRNRGEETARTIAANTQQGLEPPTNLPLHFQDFLYLIAGIYDKNPLGLDLVSDYWCPVENITDMSFAQRPTQRQVALFKFVRLAGDLLPAPLFVPYHLMLTSLASTKLSAHHCFNFLKLNGRNVGSHYSIVSWDHFFTTLHTYYKNLTGELPLASDAPQMPRHRRLTKGITPQEVQGLSAVLTLISQVVKLDDVARITLAESSQYTPIMVFLGLVTCSIPAALKASLLHCLSSFAASAEIAFNIWHGLEATQIIPTVPSRSVYFASGILMEIEEVETRNEEYPVTTAILQLLSSLLKHPIPVALGSGHRSPGVSPYLDFVRDKVLLQSSSKAYKSQNEKWEIISLCLEIMDKALTRYKIKSDMNQSLDASYVNTVGGSLAVNHPGYRIMAEMLHDSELLKMILFILDEGMRILDMYSSYPGQKSLERATLLALTLLYQVLTKQEPFLEQVRETNSSLLVTSMDSLLLSINPRIGQVDHLFVIAKYITYNTMMPHHSLVSIRILLMLSVTSQLVQHLVGVFDIDPAESEVLLNGFVECLEVDVTSEVESTGTPTNEEESMMVARNKTRQQVLLLLLNGLKYPGPNISHYLLGFNVRRPINQTEIQEPGVMGSRRTCLHAAVSLLDAGTNSNSGPVNVYKSPAATALAYQLIYTLCANKDTSGPTVRYLRSTHDFFYRHQQFLPFKCRAKYDEKILPQQAWLLRILAIELRVTSAHHQRSHVQRLLLSFLDDKPSTENTQIDGMTEPISGLTSIASFSFIQPNTGPHRRKLMQILDGLDFQPAVVPPAQWDYFGWKELQQAFQDCEVIEAVGIPLIDIEALHRRLLDEVAILKNDQRYHLIQQELCCVLEYAVRFNTSRLVTLGKKQSFDAWRQVTEVLMLACPLDLLGSEKKHQMVLEISQELIRRVMSEDFLPELMPSASGVILTLMATLRHSVFSSVPFQATPSLLPGQMTSGFSPSFERTVSISQHLSLKMVLKAVVECLLRTGSGLQRVRANFYAAFLNLLCIVQKPFDMQDGGASGVESAVLDQETENRKLRTEYVDTILSFGETIMEVTCRDACTGHDVTKMLAIAVLDMAISLDAQQQWLAFLVSKGYLRHILDSLTKDDELLQSLLNRNSNSYRIFYVFESKMALLTRISSSVAGSLALLRNGAIGKLAECRVLDLRPDLYVPPEMRIEGENWILPDLMKCYRQILKAIMKLLLSILMSLGSQHREANLQLLGYLSYNTEFFLSVLRDRSVLESLEGLEELSLITAVLSRAALEDPDNIASDSILLETRGQLLLLRQHLLSLLPCLTVTDSTPPYHSSGVQAEDNAAQMKILRLQIAAHILRLCCGAVVRSGFDASSCRVLFSPSLVDGTSSLSHYRFGSQDLVARLPTAVSKTPDLSLVVSLINQCTVQLQCSIDSHKFLLLRLQSLATLTSDELSEYLPIEGRAATSQQQQRELARECLLRWLQYRVKEVVRLSYMIECSSFILLRHLEYYLAITKINELPYVAASSSDHSIRRLQDSRLGVAIEEPISFHGPTLSQREVENFKEEVAAVFSETFFRKLQMVEQLCGKGRSHVSFLEAIVNRLKRLVRLQIK